MNLESKPVDVERLSTVESDLLSMRKDHELYQRDHERLRGVVHEMRRDLNSVCKFEGPFLK